MAKKPGYAKGQENLFEQTPSRVAPVDSVKAGIAATRAALGDTSATDTLTRFIGHQRERYMPVPDADLPAIDRFERLEVQGRINGFLPTSKTEQTEAMQGSIEQSGGIAKHLAEISRRKVKEGDRDPLRAPRSLVRNYIGWATDAKAAQTASQSLFDELTQDVNPELRLDRIFTGPEPRLLPLMRDIDLAMLRETHDTGSIGYDPQKVDYSSGNGGIMAHLEMVQCDWTVRNVTSLLPGVIARQEAREHFWTEKLEEVVQYSPAQLQAMANEGIEQLQMPQQV